MSSVKLGPLVKKGGGRIHTGPFGSQLHASDYVEFGIPCIMPANMKDSRVNLEGIAYISDADAQRLKKYIVEEGDIIYSRRGDVTQKALITNTEAGYFCGTGCLLLRPGSEFDSRYLTYYLSLDEIKKWMINQAVGATMPNLNTGILSNVPFYPVSVETQHRIAAVLSALDAKIELNCKINTELEQMTRTLYDYWFVQFDFPGAQGKPYKSSGGQMIYSNQLKREIPEGWEVQDMYDNDLFEIIKPKIDEFEGEKQYIATADVDNLNISEGSLVTYENRESRANMQPKEYTIWFAKMKASVKHILVGDYTKDLLHDAIFSTGFMGIQASKETFEYASLTIHRPYFELVKDANANGATMAAIGNNDMKNIKLVVPSPDVITSFHEVARPILEKMDLNRQQSQKLAELRDWLLPMLMNGQVRVHVGDSSQAINQSTHEPAFLAP